MTKSLNVGLKHGVASDNANRISKEKKLSGGLHPSMSSQGPENGILSKSLASFHLSPTGNGMGENDSQNSSGKGVENRQKILMDQSVDQLFKEGEVAAAQLMNPPDDQGQMKEVLNTSSSSSNQSPYNNKMKPDSIAVRQTSRNQQVKAVVSRKKFNS